MLPIVSSEQYQAAKRQVIEQVFSLANALKLSIARSSPTEMLEGNQRVTMQGDKDGNRVRSSSSIGRR